MAKQFPVQADLPSADPVSEPADAGKETSQYVTIDQAKRLAEEAAEAAYRKAQGHSDKVASRVQARLAEVEGAYRLLNNVVEMPAAQVDQVRQRVITGVLTSPEPLEPNTADKAIVDVTAWAKSLETDYGFEVEDSDPETDMVNIEGDPAAFRRTFSIAMASKAAGINKQSTPVLKETLSLTKAADGAVL